MNLVETIKSMLDDGYAISFSKEDICMDGICITIKKDGINARQVISKDELDSLCLSTDEVFATVIEHLKRSYYL